MWTGLTRARYASFVATAVLGFMLLYLLGESLEALAAAAPRAAFVTVIGSLVVVRSKRQDIYSSLTAAVPCLRPQYRRDVSFRHGIRYHDDSCGFGGHYG